MGMKLDEVLTFGCLLVLNTVVGQTERFASRQLVLVPISRWREEKL